MHSFLHTIRNFPATLYTLLQQCISRSTISHARCLRHVPLRVRQGLRRLVLAAARRVREPVADRPRHARLVRRCELRLGHRVREFRGLVGLQRVELQHLEAPRSSHRGARRRVSDAFLRHQEAGTLRDLGAQCFERGHAGARKVSTGGSAVPNGGSELQ